MIFWFYTWNWLWRIWRWPLNYILSTVCVCVCVCVCVFIPTWQQLWFIHYCQSNAASKDAVQSKSLRFELGFQQMYGHFCRGSLNIFIFINISPIIALIRTRSTYVRGKGGSIYVEPVWMDVEIPKRQMFAVPVATQKPSLRIPT